MIPRTLPLNAGTESREVDTIPYQAKPMYRSRSIHVTKLLQCRAARLRLPLSSLSNIFPRRISLSRDRPAANERRRQAGAGTRSGVPLVLKES